MLPVRMPERLTGYKVGVALRPEAPLADAPGIGALDDRTCS